MLLLHGGASLHLNPGQFQYAYADDLVAVRPTVVRNWCALATLQVQYQRNPDLARELECLSADVAWHGAWQQAV